MSRRSASLTSSTFASSTLHGLISASAYVRAQRLSLQLDHATTGCGGGGGVGGDDGDDDGDGSGDDGSGGGGGGPGHGVSVV